MNYKPLVLNGRIWAIYQIENSILFLHMLNPYELPKFILEEIEEEFIFLLGIIEKGNDFDRAAYLNLSDEEVRQICEKIPQNQI